MRTPSNIFPLITMLVETAGTEFPIENIPFGIFSSAEKTPRPGTAIGNYAVDLKLLEEKGYFRGPLLNGKMVFQSNCLNAFMALGRDAWREARQTLQTLLSTKVLEPLRDSCLVPLSNVQMHLPAQIGDYTDFYASKEHATNVGTMFRGKDNALMPNWVHLPVGYHGRASSVVVSGTAIKRPSGLVLNPTTKLPEYSQCKKLDIELEMGFFVGVGNELGEPIPVSRAEEHIFGVVLLNDWSARDIQQYEYVPLGPFLGKNFGTTISPWIVTLDALEAFRVQQPQQDPRPADYLVDPKGTPDAYDIQLQVEYQPNGGKPQVVARSNLKYMYWSFKQQLAHHTVNGCNMRTGDLCGTGTISGPTLEESGSFLELTWNGTKPMTVDGQQRTFLENGDVVSLGAKCIGKHTIGFGQCTGQVKE